MRNINIRPITWISLSAIFIAEALILLDYTSYGVGLHITNLLLVTFIHLLNVETETYKVLQALSLLPLFRILNITVPIYYSQTLFSFPFIYAPIFISCYFVIKNQDFTKQELGANFKNLGIYLPLAIVIAFVLGKIEYSTITVESMLPGSDIYSIALFMFIMLIFTGLGEELLFRSIIQTRLEQAMGPMPGLVVASLLFGAMHSGYGTIDEVVFTFSAALIIGYLFQKTRSLLFITLIHGYINIFLFGILPLGLI